MDLVANSNAQNKLKRARNRCEAESSENLSTIVAVEEGCTAGTTDFSVAISAATFAKVQQQAKHIVAAYHP